MQSVLGGSDSADNRDFADNINKSRRGVFFSFFFCFFVFVLVCVCVCWLSSTNSTKCDLKCAISCLQVKYFSTHCLWCTQICNTGTSVTMLVIWTDCYASHFAKWQVLAAFKFNGNEALCPQRT